MKQVTDEVWKLRQRLEGLRISRNSVDEHEPGVRMVLRDLIGRISKHVSYSDDQAALFILCQFGQVRHIVGLFLGLQDDRGDVAKAPDILCCQIGSIVGQTLLVVGI